MDGQSRNPRAVKMYRRRKEAEQTWREAVPVLRQAAELLADLPAAAGVRDQIEMLLSIGAADTIDKPGRVSVSVTAEQRVVLEKMVATGDPGLMLGAGVVLALAEGVSVSDVATEEQVCQQTVRNIRSAFIDGGVKAVRGTRWGGRGRPRKSAAPEAH